SSAAQPVLEVRSNGTPQRRPFVYIGPGRGPNEGEWWVELERPQPEEWQFRVDTGHGRYETPAGQAWFCTGLTRLWLQDGQIFAYRPAPILSPARVEKIAAFEGSLPARPLYVYLPRGYAEQPERTYPVLYMHDGQNCFAAYAKDSFAGSWRADETASWLIGQGRMAECVIVAVGNGQSERLSEYLPPYVTHRPPAPSIIRKAKTESLAWSHKPMLGRADQTAAYYRYEVADTIARTYRVRRDRAETATCGSSMGGLFSLYLAWEWTDFARRHAVMSPSLWVTRSHSGPMETVERLRSDRPRDLRLWLDSGTQDSPDQGDDGMLDTRAAYEALLENGYQLGPDFQYYLDEGAGHNEAAWAGRLPLVLQFLFPPEEEGVISK
ncbi:MAG: alpha/beta hydrolase, partial [Anaerolineae bacterium]|nr:alpha/beta hydrolase [Anaerolineae bacterium]